MHNDKRKRKLRHRQAQTMQKTWQPSCFLCGEDFRPKIGGYHRTALHLLFPTAKDCRTFFRIEENSPIDLSKTYICLPKCLLKVQARTWPIKGKYHNKRKLKRTETGQIVRYDNGDKGIFEEHSYMAEVGETLAQLQQENAPLLTTAGGAEDVTPSGGDKLPTVGMKPPSKWSTLHTNIAKAITQVKRRSYLAGFRGLIRCSVKAKRALVEVCCDILRSEKKKYLNRNNETYFSRTVTPQRLDSLSLEEAAVAADDVSPSIVKCLRAILPKPKVANRVRNREYTESVVNNRLGFILGVALFTNYPLRLRFIQTCLGIKLQREELKSLNTWKWLHEAGISLRRQSSREALKELDNQQQRVEGSQVEPEGEQRRPCTKCSKVLSGPKTLSRHMRHIHPVHRPHMCVLCEKTFPSEEECRNHEAKIHDEARTIADRIAQVNNNSGTFPCTKCSRMCTDKRSFLYHMRKVHSGTVEHVRSQPEKKTFLCRTCGCILSSISGLKHHVLHVKCDRLYTCLVCDKKFRTEGRCAKHEKRHTRSETSSSNTFLCKTCGCVLRSRIGLKRHESHVHAARLNTCSVCDRRFKTEGLYAKHICHTRTSNKSNRLTENMEELSPVDGETPEQSMSSSTKKNYEGKLKRPVKKIKKSNIRNEIEAAATNILTTELTNREQTPEQSMSSSTKKKDLYKWKRKRPVKKSNIQNEMDAAATNLETTGSTDSGQDSSSPSKKRCLQVESTIPTITEDDPYQLLSQLDDLNSNFISDVVPDDAENITVMTVDETFQIDSVIDWIGYS